MHLFCENEMEQVNNNSDKAKPISTRMLVCSALVLLGAAGIGMVIREYRFRSAAQNHPAQIPEAVQQRDTPTTRQVAKKPEIRYIPEPPPIEEVYVEPEPPISEPEVPPAVPMLEANVQNNTGAQEEPPVEMFEQDSQFEDPQAKEQRARAALGRLGHDPDADEIWIELINDPGLSADARSNLIEDLNEDGLSYRNLTMDDLPVIEYRLELIEELLPYAMDQVNEDAFKEARKDLVNMSDRLRR